MSVLNQTEWHEFLSGFPDAHFLQSYEWGELKSRFGWKPVRVANGQGGAQLLFRKLPLGFSIGYIPKGPLGVCGHGFWAEIDQVCRKNHALFLKIEPDTLQADEFISDYQGFITSPHNIQPPNTIILDLEKDESDLLNSMHQKTRYNINLAKKKSVKVGTWDDIPAFHKMITRTAERDGFAIHTLNYYQSAYDLFHPLNSCELLVARLDETPLAALMVFARGFRAWYVFGASSDLERNRMPTYLLQWEAIRWARQQGCRTYDFWGIPDESRDTLESNYLTRNDGLWGVYRFKRGFGGELARFHQAIDRVYSPFLYSLYLRRVAGRESP